VFDHVTIRVSDRAASERFYETVLATLGITRTSSDGQYAEWDDFSLAEATADRPATRCLHVAFGAPSRDHADAFWRAGTGAGHRDDGAPGPRPQYRDDYYGAFLLDPDGNSAEAVHHQSLRPPGHIDHLWIRVADVAASKRFYETVALHAGLRLGIDTPEHVQFRGVGGSFSLVRGTPTQHLHVAFPATDDATVGASTAPPSPPATATTARPASAPSTTPATTRPTCSTPTETAWRWSTTTAGDGAASALDA
jgi:catechol 2,3-dioxygenase-like lactoylglutathione lyase family enzyme